MSKPEHFDILILGSGAGGKLLAWNMGGAGKRVAMVERRWVGGACPNIACMPSKNEIASARVAHLVKKAAEFGTDVTNVSTNMPKVLERKRTMVSNEVAFHLNAYKDSGTELIMGEGRFVAPKVIEVSTNDGGTRLLTADHVVINVGTHALIPNIPGLSASKPLTHIEALELDYVPPHVIVIGGGYVGLEMAQALHRFGSRVTVLQSGSQLLSREDADVAEEIHRIFEAEGINIILNTEIVRVEGRSGKAVSVFVKTDLSEITIKGTDILVAAGRVPNTADIGLEEVGIKLDNRNFIQVNDKLQTTSPDVWAVGECAGSPFFTHVSADDFRIVMSNLTGVDKSKNNRLIPSCVFTDPPLAHVGLNEREAKNSGVEVRVAKLPMSGVLRTAATGESQGFMKVLVSAKDDTILGFTMIGSEAGEIATAIQVAMIANLPYTKLRDAIIAHMTMAEGLNFLFAKLPPRIS